MFFNCLNCGKKVSVNAPGTKNRNHCPFCLYSVHVDIKPGDRESKCKGPMYPVGKVYKLDGEEVLVHECKLCGYVRKNRVAGDDNYEIIEKLPELDAQAYL